MIELRWWAPWALPIIERPVENALVSVRDGIIAEVRGGVSEEQARAEGAECFPGCVIAPGFVNAHSHIEYASYHALTDALPFHLWIDDHVQRKRRLTRDHMLASARVGAWEAVAGGITCLGDASFSGDAAAAMHEVGLRGRVYLEVFGTSAEEGQLADLVQRLDELPTSDRLEVGISPHAPYTVSERLYRLVAATGMPWMTHLLESQEELEFIRTGTGPLVDALRVRGMDPHRWPRSPVLQLGDVLGGHVVAVHVVRASDEEVEQLAAGGVPVVHCPRSNARLGCGVMDLDRLDRAGVLVALGTDSPASAGAIDMFDEMRTAIELHRAVRGDATCPDAARVLRMATVDAALALGYDTLGVIAPGAKADLVACETGPTREPTTAYVMGGSPAHVVTVMISGGVVWRRDMNLLRRAREDAAETRSLLALPVRRPARLQP